MFQNRGKLIVLEGGDGSGKSTQAKLLVRALKKYDPVSFFEFPRYKKSGFGQLIRRSLAGEFGDFLNLSPYLSSLPYILDRVRAKYLLLEALKEGNVICDRYTPSNMAHHAAKLPPRERLAFVEFLEKGEYSELGLPAPDLVLYLWVPAEISAKLLAKRRRTSRPKIDQHEQSVAYQKAVEKTYLWLSRKRRGWQIIRCVENDKLLSPRAIHQRVMAAARKVLKLK